MRPAVSGDPTATAADPALVAAVTADLLAAGGALQALARALTLAGALAAVAAAAGAIDGRLLVPGLVAVAAGLPGLWLGLRTGLDARLFARLAAAPDLDAFDRAMGAAGLMPAGKAGRPLGARVAGARRLLALQAAALAAQLVLPVVAASAGRLFGGGP